jgi:hypothetical protein
VDADHGVWGGCWCMGFHAEGPKYDDQAQALARARRRGPRARRARLRRTDGRGLVPVRLSRGAPADQARARVSRREIALLGGGTVESYPEDVAGRTVSNSFLHNGTVGLVERDGFTRGRRLGKHHWVVSRTVTV